MKEKVVLFGKTKSLVGILTAPPETEGGSKRSGRGRNRDKGRPGIIFLNSGLLHRVGPNRLYVKMARALASHGFVVLRFDLSGIGDSTTSDNTLPFTERAVAETQDAMNYLTAAQGIGRFILIGICSGANISFKAACRDQRVVAIAPINAPFHFLSENERLISYVENRHRARCYWKIHAFNPYHWLKVIKGQANYRGIREEIDSQIKKLFSRKQALLSAGGHSVLDLDTEAEHFKADVNLLAERNVEQMFIYSEVDRGLDYLDVILGKNSREVSEKGKLKVEVIANADHTFTLIRWQEYLIKLIVNWADGLVRSPFV